MPMSAGAKRRAAVISKKRAAAMAKRKPQPAPWQEELDEVDMELGRLGLEISAVTAQQKEEGGSEADWPRRRRLASLLRDYHILAARSSSSKSGPAAMTKMSESDRTAKVERLREQKLLAARRLLDEYGDAGAQGSRMLQAEARCIDFDLKQRGIYFNALYYFPDLDYDEESPIGPMRFTDTVFEGETVEVDSVGLNILSVKIACSDIGFPIQVYGTVVARDSTDYKRVYLFQRDSDHCQIVNSKKEGLILSGPKRGLVLLDDDYVETDVWVKDNQGHCRQFSKGLLTIPGLACRRLRAECGVVATESLATRLSTVDVRYEVVRYALEATISVEVVQGEFRGIIAAHTSSNKRRIHWLYDDTSKVAAAADGGNNNNSHGGRGVIQLMRPALSVSAVEDELRILAKTAGSERYKRLKFPSRVHSGDDGVLTLGDVIMHVKVDWSVMHP